MIHRFKAFQIFYIIVVNCFQNPILEDDSQDRYLPDWSLIVVNCFQNPILEDDSQAFLLADLIFAGCELLSESYFRG